MLMTERAVEILRLAEGDLRALVAEAASQGDYESASLLVSWAQAIRDLARTSTLGSQHSRREQVQRVIGRPPGQQPAGQARNTIAVKVDSRKAYPRFFRRKDQIIKVGWSRRAKREYQHKAPFSVLAALSSTLATIGGNGRVFSTDHFVPLKDPSSNSEFPTYQVYVCLALLRKAGLVEQHGRQGYSILHVSEFSDAARAAWQQLSEK